MNQDYLIRNIGEAFRRSGHRAFLVGGSVRDRLLGRPSPDLDFATDALPEQTKSILRSVRPESLYSVGEKFGTIGAVVDGVQIEVTTFRAEKYEPRSRHPAVTFGESLEADLARRDFTINAMALDPLAGEGSSELIDPFGGQADLRNRLIRAVGAPVERFDEDPLRLLRAIRFAAQLGFHIDAATRDAIRTSAPMLADISKERIAAEFTKLLVSPHPVHGIRLAIDLGLMPNIVPELLEMQRMPPARGHKDVFSHTMMVVERIPADPLLRWAALLHDIAKPRTYGVENGEVHFRGHERVGEHMAIEILRRLRLDAGFIAAIGKIVRMHIRANAYDSTWTDSALRRMIREAGPELKPLIALCRADVTSQRPARVEAAQARASELEARAEALIAREDVERLDSPLDGNALMQIFDRPPGRWIGEVKSYLLNLVLDGDLAPDDTETAEQLARLYIAGHNLFAEPARRG